MFEQAPRLAPRKREDQQRRRPERCRVGRVPGGVVASQVWFFYRTDGEVARRRRSDLDLRVGLHRLRRKDTVNEALRSTSTAEGNASGA
jgi:hypothetical protein